MPALVIIPARLGSTRLPAKALAAIDGKPMILHVVDRAREADVGPVVVATDSSEIACCVATYGGAVAMTAAHHPCGSDRVFEAATAHDPSGRFGVVVNLQGDEPRLAPSAIRNALALLLDESVAIGTLAAPASASEAEDPNCVKLVGSICAPKRLRALYFTRARAPWGNGPLYRHIGLYAFRRDALTRFAALEPSPLERRERLEQLRALEAGMRIDAALLDESAPGVDTREDLAAAQRAAAEREQT